MNEKDAKMDPPLPTTAGAGSTTVGDDGSRMDARLLMPGMTEGKEDGCLMSGLGYDVMV